MNIVLDSSAVIAFLRGESGGSQIKQALQDQAADFSIHAVNLCEVFYDTLRAGDEPKAREAVDGLRMVGVLTRDDLDIDFLASVGRLKVGHRISLADSFALALSIRLDAPLWTADRHEFQRVSAAGVGKIIFIR